ncbi:MAG: nucleobase:cation symporter-2 family protein [bacterium]|nr:nucleobase:cation symporter-2 family protein [bacterium]
MDNTSNVSDIKPLYGIEDQPPLGNSFPLALQHVLAMFAGNITAPILVTGMLGLGMAERTFLIQSALLASALATLIQVGRFWKVGSRLPIVMGTSNAFLPAVMGIASRFGIGAVLGASFIGGIFEFGLGIILPKIRKLFSSLVIGIVVLTIGLTLIPVGIRQAAGGAVNFGSAQNLILSAIVLVSIIVFNQFGKGYVRASSILLGMALGYVVAIAMGVVSFEAVRSASWFAVPMPFKYQWSFPLPAIIAMLMMYVVTAVETVGDATAITMGGEGREATEAEITGSVLADGLGSSLGAVFNAFPNTSYSQNVGVVILTGVMSRHVVRIGAFILLAMSLVPKLAAVISVMPTAVLGGAAIIMFSMVASSGFVLLQRVTLNRRNLLIIAVSLGLGVGLNLTPTALNILPDGLRLIFAETGVATATIVALFLDQFLPVQND